VISSNLGAAAALVATAVVAAVPNLEHTRNPSPSLNPNPPSTVAHAQSPSEYLVSKKKIYIYIYIYFLTLFYLFHYSAVCSSVYSKLRIFILLVLFFFLRS